METIRIVVCGDEGVGKSSLITTLVKETFVPNIEAVLPPINVPKDLAHPTVLIDTMSNDLEQLEAQIRSANVIWLVYADHFTYERISLYWMVLLRRMGVNLPVVLCANKFDLDRQQQSDEFISLMQEFKEIESAIRCSARDNYNVGQCFYLCQRAVLYPLSPLFDSQQNLLQPALVAALSRIFFLADKDQDGYLNNKEFAALQNRCFNKNMDFNEMINIKQVLKIGPRGLTERDFVQLMRSFIEDGRHETVWGVLRAFKYTNSLSLDPAFLYPTLDISPEASVELSPLGYRFLVDLFILFDQDNDGGLNERELENLFRPTPGVPQLWDDTDFPNCTVRNEQGSVTLQSWLAQWSMSTFINFKVTLEYFAYLGYENVNLSKNNSAINNATDYQTTLTAIKVTKPRKVKKINGKPYRTSVTNRSVFDCLVLGSSGCGKSTLLDVFLQKSLNSSVYTPTIGTKTAINSVEIKGGKQVYLILEELDGSHLEHAVLSNNSRLLHCDVICLVYDSADPDSFQYLIDLLERFPKICEIPLLFVALKADLDKQQQRSVVHPESFTKQLQLQSPLHVSCNWPSSVLELFGKITNAAQNPHLYTPYVRDELSLVNQNEAYENAKNLMLAASCIGVMAVASAWIWRMS